MTIKITALLTSVCVALVYVFSAMFPGDPYFFIISSNPAVAMSRLIFASLLINLAFRKRFYSAYGHLICAGAAVFFGVFGIAGIVIAPLDYSLFNLFRPLDYVFMLESSAILGLAAASYERGTKRLPRLSRPRHIQLRPFTAGRV